MKLERNVPLAKHTTFKIGGLASHFVVVKNIDDLKEAIGVAHKEKLSILILGGGSNVLLSDSGFSGLVIKVEIRGMEWKEDADIVRVTVGAGESWDAFVAETVNRGLYGLENLSGIPGTVGGAPVQNIGAYGAEVKSVIDWVEAFNTETLVSKKFSNPECQFDYRDSFFKTSAGKKYVITRVCFLLYKNGMLHLDYKDIKNYFSKNSDIKNSVQAVRAAVIEIRSKKFPDISKIGTAGSFFKNPIIPEEHFKKLQQKFPNIPSYPTPTGGVKIPLAWILDNVCNLKGFKNGAVGIHDAQPLVLVNVGGGTAIEVKALAQKVADQVKTQTGINLEWEVQVF